MPAERAFRRVIPHWTLAPVYIIAWISCSKRRTAKQTALHLQVYELPKKSEIVKVTTLSLWLLFLHRDTNDRTIEPNLIKEVGDLGCLTL